MKQIIIVGNGISGITLARHIRKRSDHKITVISSEAEYFFSRTALMYVYMGHMKFSHIKPYEDWFWEKNDIQLIHSHVDRIRASERQLRLSSGEFLNYDTLVIATGSKSNKFDWPGQDLRGVGGLYSFQDLQAMEEYSTGLQRAVVVGGGLIGIEMAEMFHSRQIPVTILVREPTYWGQVLPPEESAMVNREIRRNGIELRLNSELKEILSDDAGRARAVLTKEGDTIDCQFVGLTAGVSPNLGLLEGNEEIETDKGILVDRYFRTNVEDVYAIGDCVQFRDPPPGRKKLEQVWYTGRLHGETLALTLTGNETPYSPGPWFNSAKFINIEFQTYGDVPAEQAEDCNALFWEDEDGKRSFRIVYEKEGGKVRGFNLMGIRVRHELCHRWLSDGVDIRHVLENLRDANFDPEFSIQYETHLIDQYNSQYPGEKIALKKKKGFFASLMN